MLLDMPLDSADDGLGPPLLLHMLEIEHHGPHRGQILHRIRPGAVAARLHQPVQLRIGGTLHQVPAVQV
ncbi:hypothetical protein D3C75_659190 [compost metagenome]